MSVQTQHQIETRLALFSLLCSNLVWLIPLSGLAALALALIPQEEQMSLVVRLSWITVVCAVLIGRAIILKHWLQDSTTADNLQERLNLATVLTAVTACCYGAFGYIAISPDNPAINLVIVMVFTGMVASATAAISYLLPMYLLFILPVMLPVGIRMYNINELSYLWISALIFIYLAASVAASRSIRASILRSVELRFENIELLENVKHQHQRAEIALAREEKANLAKSSFLAAASHDLRQPLHSLRLFTATLEMQTRNTEHKTLVSQIDSSVKSLEELFNALLDISKLDAGTITVERCHVYLDTLLSRIESEFKPLAEEKNLQFIVQCDEQVVHTDIPLLETLVRNLVSNAIRYTDAGSVTITTESINGRVSIAVADTGVGIAEADQGRIFEEFVQLGNAERNRNQGIGLGLSIVKRLADLLDVSLRVESNKQGSGQGVTFYADVPQGDESQCRTLSTTLPQFSTHFGSLFVLVIDDEEEACLALEGLLETWGCTVMCATSGDAAIQQLREIGEVPDLVVSDYRLRDGETGGDVIVRVRDEVGLELPAIIVTGDIASDRLLDIKALDLPLLHKPCEPEALRQLISRETTPRETAPMLEAVSSVG